MKISMRWEGKMKFTATDGVNSVLMDTRAPVGEGAALSPKQLCLAAVCGCTGMDVVGLLRKHKQDVKDVRVEANAPVKEGYPATFTEVVLDFFIEGEVEQARAIEAVELSQTKFCGVSAMIAKACPIRYRIQLNGEFVHESLAKFPD